MTIFVDSNVLLDVVTIDPVWSQWSVTQLDTLALTDDLVINDIVYAEISVGYDSVDQVNELVDGMKLKLFPISREALFVGAKIHQRYRKAGGTKTAVLPDFLIGAQALLSGSALLTRDTRRYRSYFPQLELITPDSPEIG